jgi:Flp pilus assembly pilin Flp
MRAECGRLWARLATALQREDGQAMTEYALVIALVVAIGVALAAATGLAQSIVDQISNQLGKVL